MKLLSIDTSGAACSVAVFADGRLKSEEYRHHQLNHSAVLLGMIDSCLAKAGHRVSEMDAFAVSIGPGSFTGLRIGIGTVKAFAQATGKKIAGVSTLDLLAQNAPEARGVVCPLIDARNNRVFTAVYEDGKKLTEEAVLSLEELGETLPAGKPAYFLGDGALAYRSFLEESFSGCAIAPCNLCLQRASGAYSLALTAIEQGRLLTCEEAKLNYLVQSQAERNFG